MSSEDAVSLAGFPQQLATALGIPLFAGQVLATVILMSIVLIPILYFTKGRNPLLAFIVGLCMYTFAIAMTWLPYWMLILLLVAIAGMFSSTMRDWITGKGRG
jgi:hypothetical protein